jgi:hypothetical protein
MGRNEKIFGLALGIRPSIIFLGLCGLTVYTTSVYAATVWNTLEIPAGQTTTVSIANQLQISNVHTWKEVTLTETVAVWSHVIAKINILPGQLPATLMEGMSNSPFTSISRFTNNGTDTQSLAGSIQEGGLTPINFGPFIVDSGQMTPDLSTDVMNPNTQGIFTISQDITDVGINDLWTIEIWQHWKRVSNTTWSDHHWWSDVSFFSEELMLENMSTDTISVDVHYSYIPVPSAIWMFGSALVGLIGINVKKKKPLS